MTDGIEQPAAQGRVAIVGTRKTLAEIALSFGCTERTIWNVVERENVPYIKFLGRRYVEPADISAALLRKEVRREPRRAGRPRKAA